MKLTLRVWRQPNAQSPGTFEQYHVDDVTPDLSFLEMLDLLNDELQRRGVDPIAFDHDCREGICGACSMMINGFAHGPEPAVAACQLYLRHFKDGDTIVIEPWRAKAFPLIKDLVVDRSAFDRVIQAGGYVSVDTGEAPEANSIPVPKKDAEEAMDAAACIGCGACVAACPNASAMLFVAAKVAHLERLPQGKVEHPRRVRAMVEAMDKEGFGNCTNHYECMAACPKSIHVKFIARMNRGFLKASAARRQPER
ncbi:MAG: hypothetical protein A3D28_00955 [Omnitrophica bacterium RIFCSPHIGHO2_02_FULL_63_14]|nr:MAG: hypothetical protein A3D28_00955 [Omnitrophica bacterium RIFCSPHIGHO2_02_FULL_63_14]